MIDTEKELLIRLNVAKLRYLTAKEALAFCLSEHESALDNYERAVSEFVSRNFNHGETE